MIHEKNKSIFKTLLDDLRFPIAFRNWRTAIIRPIKNTARYVFLKPYYKLKWFKLDLSTKHMQFIKWELKNPLKVSYMSRSNSKHCQLCKEKYCYAMRDRFFERYIWSSKIKYIETTGTCETRLFEPYESFLSSGGEYGGMYLGDESTWTTFEKERGSICPSCDDEAFYKGHDQMIEAQSEGRHQ